MFNAWHPAALACAAFAAFGFTAACSAAEAENAIAAHISDKDWSEVPGEDLIPRLMEVAALAEVVENPALATTPDLKTLAGSARRLVVWMNPGTSESDVLFAEARTLLESACRDGQMRGCRDLGGLLLNEPATRSEAEGHLETACARGNLLACHDLSRLYSDGKNAAPDHAAALKYLDLTCAVPGNYPCAMAANSYAELDFDAALARLGDGCEAGQIFACHWAGHRAGNSKAEGMLALAVRRHDQACRLGLPASCMSLLEHVVAGDGAPANLDAALSISDQFCRSGDLASCYLMMSVYNAANNQFLKPDAARAFEYMSLGCELNDRDSCRWTAEALEAGNGTPASPQGAHDIYARLCGPKDQRMCQQAARIEVRLSSAQTDTQSTDLRHAVVDRACEIGDGEACRGIAWWHVFGEEDRAKDVALATLHFELGCQKGNAMACIDLGSLHEWQKFGFAEDKAEAERNYLRACDLGDGLGCKLYHDAQGRPG